MNTNDQNLPEYFTLQLKGGVDRPNPFEAMGGVAQLPDGVRNIILDFSTVDFLNSKGLGEVVHFVELAHKNGQVVILASPTPFVSRIFKLMRIDYIAPVMPTLEEAIAHLRGRHGE